MKKVSIVFAVVIVLSLIAYFVFANRNDPASVNESLETEKVVTSGDHTLETEGVELSGKVVDGITKQPLAAKIKVKNENVVIAEVDCNASGEFVIPLKDGSYEIAVEHPHYVAKGKYDVDRLIEIDSEPVRLDVKELWPEAVVKGRVVWDDQGVDAELQFIYQIDRSEAKHYLFKTIKTDRDGYFTLDKAYGGIQNIRISSDNLVSQKFSDVELVPGKTLDLGEIPMKLGLTVFGTVNDKNSNKGIAGASVLCINLKNKIIAETKTAEDGSYTLPVVDQDKLRVVITADGFYSNNTLIDTQSQNRYEYNVAMNKLDEIKHEQNDTQSSKNVENNDELALEDSADKAEEMAQHMEEVAQYKDKVQNVVKENASQLRECYQNLLAIEAASGKVVFNFMASSSGDIYDIKINNTEINNEEFLDCLSEIIANFQFPQRSDDDLVMIEYPFLFFPDKR